MDTEFQPPIKLTKGLSSTDNEMLIESCSNSLKTTNAHMTEEIKLLSRRGKEYKRKLIQTRKQ